MNRSQKLLTYLVAVLSASGACNGAGNVGMCNTHLKYNMLNMNTKPVCSQPRSEVVSQVNTGKEREATNVVGRQNAYSTAKYLLPAAILGVLLMGGVICTAQSKKWGPFAPDTGASPGLPNFPDIPSCLPDTPQTSSLLPGNLEDAPAPATFNNYIKPVFTDENVDKFKKNFLLRKKGAECEPGDCKIPHGIANGGPEDDNEYFSLYYDPGYGEQNIQKVPNNFVDRVVLLMPLLGKKYTGCNTPEDQFVKDYIINILGKDSCITLSTVPDGPDKDKIWIVFDGNIKNGYWIKNSDKYFEDDNYKYIAVKADNKNMWANYTNCISQFCGHFIGDKGEIDGFKHLYKFYGPNSGSKVEKMTWNNCSSKE